MVQIEKGKARIEKALTADLGPSRSSLSIRLQGFRVEAPRSTPSPNHPFSLSPEWRAMAMVMSREVQNRTQNPRPDQLVGGRVGLRRRFPNPVL